MFVDDDVNGDGNERARMYACIHHMILKIYLFLALHRVRQRYAFRVYNLFLQIIFYFDEPIESIQNDSKKKN